LRTDGGPAFTLFVEPRQPEAEVWNGYRPGVEGAVRDYGADAAFPCDELITALPKLLEKVRRVFHVLGRNAALDAKLIESLDSMRLRSRMGLVPPAEIVDPRSILHEMRLFKESSELEIMRQAADISREAHAAAARLAQDGAYEYELEAMLDFTFRRRGATGPAYASIVGGGKNATVLHYITNDQPLREGELVLVDAGCELQGYASDVTRTYPVGGKFEGAARSVYELVLAAQEAAFAVAKAGATLEQLHTASVRVLTDGMVQLGLLSGSLDDLVASDAYRKYYMHRTSHWLGLDVHDVGAYTANGKPRTLEPGMVFTIEPGLYIAAEAEGVTPHLRGIGVRIEDDVLITPGDHQNLTAAIPKRPEDVEAWVRDA
ncbi:MAG TPA: aminopeptidase P N-terminal domain-containing protein, partial [Myxococcota bacterium]|nr:aminopeptidase P N-terminal domain-containing protein [Myxococcota bacterium]